ncbi:unnamed protein product [Spirodela intermedia]|uniref:Uncharacterized protein n=1 Tax=Spirodela intermedia TaxID=51605 RepID=A0A7I8L4Z3_SPIIN|nr:unnamed protein product [Spirodela intermedia]
MAFSCPRSSWRRDYLKHIKIVTDQASLDLGLVHNKLEGFVDTKHDKLVYKLNRPLYGYIEKILCCFNMEKVKLVRTPLARHSKLSTFREDMLNLVKLGHRSKG